MVAWHQPFELYYWLVTVFAGNITLFTAIAFLAITSMAAYFRMPSILTFISFAMFVIMLSVYLEAAFIVVLLVAGLAIGWTIARIWKT